MPYLNCTGPMWNGPMTGKGQGTCGWKGRFAGRWCWK